MRRPARPRRPEAPDAGAIAPAYLLTERTRDERSNRTWRPRRRPKSRHGARRPAAGPRGPDRDRARLSAPGRPELAAPARASAARAHRPRHVRGGRAPRGRGHGGPAEGGLMTTVVL